MDAPQADDVMFLNYIAALIGDGYEALRKEREMKLKKSKPMKKGKGKGC